MLLRCLAVQRAPPISNELLLRRLRLLGSQRSHRSRRQGIAHAGRHAPRGVLPLPEGTAVIVDDKPATTVIVDDKPATTGTTAASEPVVGKQESSLFDVPQPARWTGDALPKQLKPLDLCGRFTWDFAAGKAEPHIRRLIGKHPCFSMQGTKGPHRPKGQRWTPTPGEEGLTLQYKPGFQSYADAQRFLMSWLRARELLIAAGSVEGFEQYPFQNAHMLPAGQWLYVALKDAKHPLRDQPQDGWRFGYHGSSMYCVRRAWSGKSLTTGMASIEAGGKVYKGVYYHKAEFAHLCQQTYMHYVAFNGGPFCFSPLMVLHAEIATYNAKEGRMMSTKVPRKGVDQMLTYPGRHELVGILFHVLDLNDFMALPSEHWISLETGWAPELELGGRHTRWEDILLMSEKEKDKPPTVVIA